MENELINSLADEIVIKLKDKINIQVEMKKFLNSQINVANKEKVLEQLYLFQLYSNAYTGIDPRGNRNSFGNVILVLSAKTNEEVVNRIEKLQETVEFMKNIEIHPLSTTKRKLEDKEKYKNVMF